MGLLVLFNFHLLNVICVGAAGFCILGGQNVLNNFTAASYDTEVRGTGVGMMLGVGRAGGILGPFCHRSASAAYIGNGGPVSGDWRGLACRWHRNCVCQPATVARACGSGKRGSIVLDTRAVHA